MGLDRVTIESSISQATGIFQGNKAKFPFNEKKTDCVKLAPRGDQKSSQAQSTRLTIAHRLRNHTRIEPWQSEKASSLGRRELAGLRGVRDIRTKASIDDTNYSEEQNPFFNEEELKAIFTRRFTKLLEKNQYISPLPEQKHEFSSISYHTNPLHIREEWREAFLIAKGQIFDKVIMKGKIIEGDLLHDNPHKILLLREASTQINPVSNDRLPSTVATMLEQHPNQEVVACISMNENLDSYFTCLKVDEKLAYQVDQTLNKDQYQQKLQQLKIFEEERKDILKPQMQFLRINSEALFIQDDIKQKLSQNIVERIKDLETELLRLQREERMELRRYQSFYMLLGTPEIRSIVGNLRKMCTLASITLIASNENIHAPEERNQPDNGSEHALQKCHYIARLAFKHANNDKIDKEHINQFILQQQKFKQIFLQVLAEQDSSPLLLQRYATELSSISSNARVFDLPTQWQKAFLIARGQAYESARKDGTRLSNNPYSRLLPENEHLTLHLETSGREYKQIPRNDLPSALAAIFKQKPHEKVFVSTTTYQHEPDTRFTCKIISEGLNLQAKQELRRDIYTQKLQEWIELRGRQDKQEFRMLQSRQNYSEYQFFDLINQISPGIRSEKQIITFQKHLDEMKDLLESEQNKIMNNQKIEAARQKQALSEAQNTRDAYDMLFGTPKLSNITEILPKDCTTEFMTIEPLARSSATEPTNERITADAKIRPSGAWLAGDDYEISLCITYTGRNGKSK